MRSLVTVAALALALLSILTGCAADPPPRLTFATHMSVNPGNETVVVGEVRNAGYIHMRSLGALDGVLQIRDTGGALVACAAVPEFTAAVQPGGSDFPLHWQGLLDPGSYELTWGAPAYGGVRSGFALVERENGLRLERGTTTRLQGASGLTTCEAARSQPSGQAQ